MTFRRRGFPARISCCFLAIVLAFVCSTAARASSLIHIYVNNADGHPVAGAVVSQLRPGDVRATLGTTDATGLLVATVPLGASLTASSNGITASPVTVVDDIVHLQIGARVIASVQSRSTLGSPHSISDTSTEALLAGNLRNALRLNPQYRSAAEGGSGESEVNGIPLPLPASGTSAGAGHFSTDLFASETPTDPDGSAVPDFHLVNPTAIPTQTAELTLGSFGQNDWRSTFSGRQGSFGYGLAFVVGGDGGTLYDQHIRDLSGYSYDHASNARHIGTSLNTSFEIAKTSLSFSAIAEARNSADIPTILPGSVPLGYGPETALPSNDLTYWMTADHALGKLDLFYVGVHYGGGANIDHANATFLGQSADFDTSYAYNGTYQELKVTRSLHNLSYFAQGTLQLFGLNNDQGVGEIANARSGARDYTVGLERSGNLSYGGYTGVHGAFGGLAGTQAVANAHAALTSGNTAVHAVLEEDASADQQSFGAPAQVLAPAESAQINCSAGTALVGAPAALTQPHPRRLLADLSVTRRTRKGEVDAGGYLSAERNALVNDIAEQPLVTPTGYLTTVSDLFAGTCAGQVFSPQGLLAERLVQVPSLQSREAYVSAKRTFGRFELSGFYEVLSQFASGPPTTAFTLSSIVAGSQMQSVPLQRANIALSYSHRSFLLAADALYTATNNSDDLPGHVELMLGTAAQIRNGTLSLSVQNPFGGYGGLYTSSTYAVPVMTTSGPLRTLANPMLRTWELTYHLTTAKQ